MSHENDQTNLWRSSSMLYRYGQIYLARGLEEMGIGRGASQAVPLIMRFPGIGQDSLAKKMNLDKGTVARIIRQLEEGGYVIRRPDEKDARANRVFPTEELSSHLPYIEKMMTDWYDIVFEGIDPQKREEILLLLEQMAENAKDYTGRK